MESPGCEFSCSQRQRLRSGVDDVTEEGTRQCKEVGWVGIIEGVELTVGWQGILG
jgi:hypothetical protein